MRIIVADGQTLFRLGLRLLLEEAFGAETEVLEAADLGALMAVLRDTPRADLVISDLFIEVDDPFAALRAVVEGAAGVPLIVVSASEARGHIVRSIACGASGYLVKHENFKVLRHVIELVVDGGRYVPPQALDESKEVLHWLPPAQPTSEPVGEPQAALPANGPHTASRLTKQQSAIWQLLADGHAYKEIAHRLALDETTVKSQTRSIYRKLGVRNRTQAALLAVGEALEKEPSEAA